MALFTSSCFIMKTSALPSVQAVKSPSVFTETPAAISSSISLFTASSAAARTLTSAICVLAPALCSLAYHRMLSAVLSARRSWARSLLSSPPPASISWHAVSGVFISCTHFST